MNKRQGIILIVPFLVITFGLGAINFIKKDKETSSAENRALAKKPTIEALQNREYKDKYEEYYTDQFIGRDSLLKLNTKLEMAMKKSSINGHYITEDGWLLGGPTTLKLTKEDYKDSTELINKYAKELSSENKEVYYVTLPHKVNTLDFLYPKKYLNGIYGLENSKLLLSTLDKNYITPIDIGTYFSKNFNEKELEDFYFKTDHHWNSLGAYEGFKYITEKMGMDISKYPYKIDYIKDKPFMGSYNRNLYTLYPKQETVPFVYMDKKFDKEYHLMKDSKLEKVEENTIVASGVNQGELNYGNVYTENYGYYKVTNKEALTDKKILVVRDSYQSPLTWLFSDLFEEMEVVDPRYVEMGFDEILKNSNSDIVMFMFNNSIKPSEIMERIID
ncbi:alginate O-acetyltransferase AlgX-related protein [Romboutsia sp.]|uniref:alginate O-acetyltransferase AlgX-related protein n=1 Tax=Romboutsia sp. TaxID=1965302 RepID=UPI003F3FBEE3